MLSSIIWPVYILCVFLYRCYVIEKRKLHKPEMKIIYIYIYRGNIEKTMQVYGLPEGTAITRIMLHKNMKSAVRLPDSDTKFFDIITGGGVLVV